MAKALWNHEARKDLKAIALYIGRQDQRPSTAAKIVREIQAKCDGYATHFASGSIVGEHHAELGPGYRTIGHKRWVVIFRPIEHGIEVLRVVDAALDYPTVFREERPRS